MGNISDKTRNGAMLSKIKTIFLPEVLKDLVYVADCSFPADGNLEAAGDDVRFISRMPATFGMVSKVIREAWDAGRWELVDSYASRKETAEHWVYETVRKISGKTFEFIAVCSSSMD